MGIFPRVVYANDDGLKDLLVGRADGTIVLYLNVNTNADPRFDAGTLVEVGGPGSKVTIDVGSRAAATVVDWDNDLTDDLVVGALDGLVRVYVSEGAGTWDFRTVQYVQENGGNLLVPTVRSSPHIMDFDDDGNKDLLAGNTEGQLLFYSNVGSDESPVFSGYAAVEADSVPIDLAGSARSRPFVCDWNSDGISDVLIGGSDGLVHLYLGVDILAGVDPGERPAPFEVARLSAAFPNPFNPSVTVPFVLRERRPIELSVIDTVGRRVAILADRVYEEGEYRVRWRGIDNDGREVPSGVYFVRLRTPGTSVSTKVVLLR
jgi:hypothetical protein